VTGGQDWLSRTLRALREEAGLSGVKAAAAVRISQPRISRIESGRFVPTEDEIKALCRLYRAPVDTRRQLLQAAADLRAETTPARVVLQRGAWKMQQRIQRIERDSSKVSNFQPAIIPGLLQTADYARLVFADGYEIAPEDLERSVSVRQERGAALGSGREFTLIMTEGPLRWQAGGPEVMVGQLSHMADVATAQGVHLGIIPQSQPVRVFPLHSFSIYDDRAVTIGTRTATAFITDEREVADYVELFAMLTDLATFGDGARAILDRIAGEYRSMI
jgi:transcriptional regulator with XRE-family HTH domain